MSNLIQARQRTQIYLVVSIGNLIDREWKIHKERGKAFKVIQY